MTTALQRVLPATTWPTVGYLTVFLVLPVGVLAVYSFWIAEFFEIRPDFTLKNYLRVFGEGIYLQLVLRSIGIGLIVAAVSVPVSFLLAYAITFRLARFGSYLLILVMVSMLSSYLVRIYAWKTILGPNGVINQALGALGVIDQPLAFLLYGDFAIIVTLTHILVPYATLPIYAALQNIDRAMIEASRDLGAPPLRTFARVTLPLAMPGVSAAFLFTFILAAADYVTPQLVGGSSGMLVGRVIADQFGLAGNPPFGAALSIVLMAGYAVVIATLWLAGWTRRRLRVRGTRAARPAGSRSGPGVPRWLRRVPWMGFAAAAILAFLYLPLVIVVIFSFNESTAGIFPIKGFSLRWYAELIASDAFMRALRSSLMVAVAAVAGSLLIAVPAAFVIARRRFALKPALLALVIGPIAVPGVVVGISLLAALTSAGFYGGLVPAGLAHVLFSIPFVVLVMRARLSEFDWQLEEAGRDLGSSPLRVLRTVTLPITAPAMIGAGILVAALSLDEFIITNFVIGANTTLPVYIWSQMRTGITPSVNAVASLILLGSFILLAASASVLWRGAGARRAFAREVVS